MDPPFTPTAAQRLALLAEHASDYALFMLDAEGLIVEWTPAAERLMGWLSSEVVGRSADFLFTPEDQAAGVPAAEIQTARANGKAPDMRWHVRKDGSRFFVDGVLTAIRAAS